MSFDDTQRRDARPLLGVSMRPSLKSNISSNNIGYVYMQALVIMTSASILTGHSRCTTIIQTMSIIQHAVSEYTGYLIIWFLYPGHTSALPLLPLSRSLRLRTLDCKHPV
jgi:hypothetical protein